MEGTAPPVSGTTRGKRTWCACARAEQRAERKSFFGKDQGSAVPQGSESPRAGERISSDYHRRDNDAMTIGPRHG